MTEGGSNGKGVSKGRFEATRTDFPQGLGSCRHQLVGRNLHWTFFPVEEFNQVACGGAQELCLV